MTIAAKSFNELSILILLKIFKLESFNKTFNNN